MEENVQDRMSVCQPSPGEATAPMSLHELSLEETGNETITIEDDSSSSSTVHRRSYEHSHENEIELRSPPSKVGRKVGIKEESVPSKRVIIWGLDSADIIEEHLIRFVTRKMICASLIPRTQETVLTSIKVLPDHLILEFCSVDLAIKFTDMVNLSSPTYDGQLFTAEMQPLVPDLSNTVKCVGLAEDFIKEHFVRYLNKQAVSLDLVPLGVQAVLRCSDVTSCTGSVYVEFTSVEIAKNMATFSEILVFDYEDEKISLQCIENETLKDLYPFKQSDNTLALQLPETPFLLISGLPEDFIEPHFVRYLNRQVQTMGLLHGSSSVVEHVTNCTATSVEVKFISSDIAAKTCASINTGSWIYEEIPINAELLFKSNDSDDCSAPSCSKTLTEYEETVIFLRNLVRLRHIFTGKNHEAGYARMHVDLQAQGVLWDIPTMTKKRRNLLDQYKKRSKSNRLDSWEFQKPVSVILGLQEEDILKGTDFSSSDSNVSVVDLASFTKGAVFTDSAIKYLISICILNKKQFESETATQTSLWQNISKLMQEKKYFYDGSQCERKINSLKAMYREEVRRAGKTGAEALDVPYFEEMRGLMEDDYTVHPKKTVAVGVATKVTLAKEEEENVDEPTPLKETHQKGITRAPTLQRPKKLAERKVTAIEQIASALINKYSPERE